jgi:hypothetical protein
VPRWLLIGLLALAPAGIRRARADGAFPDSGQILLPVDRPHDIYVGTNFGVLVSQDDGATWRWVCEQAVASLAGLYVVGPPPPDRLYAVSPAALVVSDDQACHFDPAAGAVTGVYVADVFPDPADPAHVVAIGTLGADASDNTMALYESRDGGHNFATPRYQGPSGWVLSGVEIARSDPQTVYIAAYEYQSQTIHPYLLRSGDGGATFSTTDLGASVGPHAVRLILVDPTNADRVYLRVVIPAGDQFAVISGGQVAVPLALPSAMSAFLRRADGSLYVGTREGAAFVSRDGAQSFSPWPGAPHLRALGERGGVLFAVGDNFADGFAVASSTDDGKTWKHLLRFDQICGLLQCPNIQAVCADPWQTLMATFGIAKSDCQQGGGGSGGGSGCGCQVARRPKAAGVLGGSGAALALLVAALVRARRRARSRRVVK